jgi:predicted HTH transcriptional regulator
VGGVSVLGGVSRQPGVGGAGDYPRNCPRNFGENFEEDFGGNFGSFGENWGETREKTLRLIEENPAITTAELAERIGITAKGIEWQLGKLKADGRIRRIGPARGGRWEVLEHPDV